MEVEILYRPSYSLGVVKLGPGEHIRANARAMVSMSEGVTMESRAGGLLGALGRAALGEESLFQNFFKAPASGGEVTFAPALPGDVFVLTLQGGKMMVQSTSYLASEMGVELGAGISARTFVAAEGFSMLEVSGKGKLLLASCGAIYEKVLGPGEKYTVDSTYLVAFDAHMPVEFRSVGGLKATLLSGEGFVAQLIGPGRILIQTRSPHAFIDQLIPFLPESK